MNNNDQNGNQNSFRHTNFNDQVKPGLIAQKKAQWNRLVTKTRLEWEKAKKTSKKVLYFSMIFYVIVSAIITSIVLINPLNHWYTYQNPENVKTLRNANSQEVDEMINSYKRINERTEKERKEEFEKQFQEVSNAIPGIKTAQAATPTLAVETTAVNGATTKRDVSAYNLVPEQTDNTPCVGAANQNLCYLMREKGMNICAANQYEFGTILKIPGYLGHKYNGDDTCIVLDRMAEKHDTKVDISMDQNIQRAKNFGVQPINVTVVGHVKEEVWSKFAPAKEHSELIR